MCWSSGYYCDSCFLKHVKQYHNLFLCAALQNSMQLTDHTVLHLH